MAVCELILLVSMILLGTMCCSVQRMSDDGQWIPFISYGPPMPVRLYVQRHRKNCKSDQKRPTFNQEKREDKYFDFDLVSSHDGAKKVIGSLSTKSNYPDAAARREVKCRLMLLKPNRWQWSHQGSHGQIHVRLLPPFRLFTGSDINMGSVGASADSPINNTYDSCEQKFIMFEPPPGEIFCNWTWDTVLCWPPTQAATTANQSCPVGRGVDPSKLAYKRCSVDGRWEGKLEGDFKNPQGWTNYTNCFTPEMLELFTKLFAGSEDSAKIKIEIAAKTRTLEIAGFSLSLAALLISLAIFFRFTSLRNNRTRIHRNLFIAMVIQVVIRLTLYIDQAIIRANDREDDSLQGIDNTPLLCEASYVLLEYARTAMFMWMFIEGLYLHNKITVTVFHEQSYYAMYTLMGWGVPVIMTAAWASATAWYYGSTKCWWGYNLTIYFWILEGPRLGVVLLNFLFLLNIIRVLVVKLRQSHTSEIEQVRKAVRAAVVLVPLLGITNIISMSKTPLEKSVWEFALWSYGTHFLTSFQGFFIAFLYCFLNGEVRTVVMKSVYVYISLRTNQFQPRRNSGFSGMFVTAVENPAEVESEMLPQGSRERPRRQRSLRGHNRSWIRLCCQGNHPKTSDTPPHETRV